MGFHLIYLAYSIGQDPTPLVSSKKTISFIAPNWDVFDPIVDGLQSYIIKFPRK